MNFLTPFNYHQWKEDIEIQLRSKGLYRVTMGTKQDPNALVDRTKYWNKLDEAYGFRAFQFLRTFSSTSLD